MSLADKLYDVHQANIDSIQLITGSGGVFEVTVNGEKVYSKKETGSFPDEEKLVADIGK
ncbi:SelT/SelW/SelH family protein [Salibacterium salarium]|uniref:SelT/SelW/SelH family protein n=1 Tax=Salibacterium salarium TaxID=284579 RepID=A0A3R9QKG8_9BACI|nr:SelT/SelW/SelH family protein [Salibacterium salarium]